MAAAAKAQEKEDEEEQRKKKKEKTTRTTGRERERERARSKARKKLLCCVRPRGLRAYLEKLQARVWLVRSCAKERKVELVPRASEAKELNNLLGLARRRQQPVRAYQSARTQLS